MAIKRVPQGFCGQWDSPPLWLVSVIYWRMEGIKENATLMSPNEDEIAVCGSHCSDC